MSESSDNSAASGAAKSPSDLAFNELADRIAGDKGLPKAIQQALLDDLASSTPVALSKFSEILKQGEQNEANPA